MPDKKELQHKEQHTAQKLTINNPIAQIPKPQPKAKIKPNRLKAPYKKPQPKSGVKPEFRTHNLGDTTLVIVRNQHKLEQVKQQEIENWKYLTKIK